MRDCHGWGLDEDTQSAANGPRLLRWQITKPRDRVWIDDCDSANEDIPANKSIFAFWESLF